MNTTPSHDGLSMITALLRHLGYAMVIVGFLKAAVGVVAFGFSPFLMCSCLIQCVPSLLMGWRLTRISSGHSAVQTNTRLTKQLLAVGLLSCVVLVIGFAFIVHEHSFRGMSILHVVSVVYFFVFDCSVIALCAESVLSLRKIAAWRKALLEGDAADTSLAIREP
jgi:hypothetical protein